MIFTLHAKLNHPDAGEIGKRLYHYDDPDHGVTCERLVDSVSQMLATMMGTVGYGDEVNPHHACTLRFTTDKADIPLLNPALPTCCLFNPKQDGGGTSYECDGMWPEATVDGMFDVFLLSNDSRVWLCEHLLDFFPDAPESFICSVEPSGWQAAAPTDTSVQG